jgi:hypothetical protein
MRSRSRRTNASLLLAAAVAAGCSDSTGPQPSDDIQAHRARWAAHGLVGYSYDYRVTGFFISYAGHHIRLEVRDGVVRSATDVATGQAMPGDPARWPTIDALFDQAQHAADAHALHAVRFDPVLDYPTDIEVSGPPDASGSVFASDLQPLP